MGGQYDKLVYPEVFDQVATDNNSRPDGSILLPTSVIEECELFSLHFKSDGCK
jgi:hypothetical protein